MHAPNFFTSRQDFHVEFMKKSVINLEDSQITDIQPRIISKQEILRINRKTGAAQ